MTVLRVRGSAARAGALALLLLVTATAGAQGVHHSFWAVRGAHNTVYLLGSVHMLKAGESDVPAVVLDAYRRADKLVMEVDLDAGSREELAQLTLREATLPAGQSLSGVLGPETYEGFAAHARDVGVDPSQLERFQPWFAAMTLLRLEYVRLGYDFESGVESQFTRLARADHKSVIGLETMQEQLGLFSHLPMPEQKRLLQYTLKDVDESPRELDEIVSAWRAGDAARLNALLAKGFDEFPELYGPLTSDRNRHWMPTLTRLLAEPRDCLVIVGALHLVGRDGVLELLRRAGYRVEQR